MRGAYLGELELLVLIAILRLGDEAYGIAIRREIEVQANRTVAIGSLYATAARLERKGLLRTWESEPEPVRGGRARRYFELTPAGNRALRQTAGMLGRMMSGLELFPASGGRP
jgi:DNA-binding PadR family transcriptional regulator